MSFVLDPQGPGSKMLVYLCIQNVITVMRATIFVNYTGMCLLSRAGKMGQDRGWAAIVGIHHIQFRASMFVPDRIWTGFLWATLWLPALITNSRPQQMLTICSLGTCLFRRGKLMTSSFSPSTNSIFSFFACTGQYSKLCPNLVLQTLKKTQNKK